MEQDNIKENLKHLDELYSQYFDLEKWEEMQRNLFIMYMQLGREIAERKTFLPSNGSPHPKPDPPCLIYEHWINGIPAYQFSFEGMLPPYYKDKKYNYLVREYYNIATLHAVQNNEFELFPQAFIYVCHFFSDMKLRDLDNRNRMHLINSIRGIGLIEGDSWQDLEYMESGFRDIDKLDHVEMFVTDIKNGLNLVKYVKTKHENGERFRV